jgi:hypothetical protein
VDNLKKNAFAGMRMHDWKFENVKEETAQIIAAKKYVATWEDMERSNQGLLFFGDVGRGEILYGCLYRQCVDRKRSLRKNGKSCGICK